VRCQVATAWQRTSSCSDRTGNFLASKRRRRRAARLTLPPDSSERGITLDGCGVRATQVRRRGGARGRASYVLLNVSADRSR
jgi:hypothetical protein